MKYLLYFCKKKLMFHNYLSFLYHSTNEHGVHSPFVFKLVTQCFYDKKRYAIYTILDQYRKVLLSNKKSINITEYGAGSRIFKSNTRAINKIAKYAGISTKRAQLLYRICTYFKIENALEIGTSLGIGTCSIALGSKRVTTIEGCHETLKIAQDNLAKFKFKNIHFIQENFDTAIPKLNERYDLIYIDGNHQKEATLTYFEHLIKNSHNDTVFIFDDIHWSKEMEEAWQLIRTDKRVTVSIDTFQWGIVSLRKEQEKEHFIIRV
jgi:predicted O-methyltransferase YrrM